MSALDLQRAISQAVAGQSFSAEQMSAIIGLIMDGEATPAQIAALLVALRMKGETVEEMVGAARALRARATRLRIADAEATPIVDTCGTGGDGAGTINVSTLAALVVAGAGVRVAKHGNRAGSSRSGSADLLEALGYNLSATVPQVERCLAETGLCFLFAPAFHGATRQAAAVRREIGVRTLFNLLGPLSNPAGVRYQVVGVYHPALLEPVARALGELGAVRVLVVHGILNGGTGVGLDEISPTGPTEVAEWDMREGRLARYVLSPDDFGLPGLAEGAEGALAGGDPVHNAARARALLEGREAHGAAWRSVIMTAACALFVTGAARDVTEGAKRATAALSEGRALRVLEALVRLSHE